MSIRAIKRKMKRKAFNEGMSAEQVNGLSAHELINDVTYKTTKLLVIASGMVLIHDYKALQKKDTRLDNYVESMHKYIKKLKREELADDERITMLAVNAALNKWWDKKGKEVTEDDAQTDND